MRKFFPPAPAVAPPPPPDPAAHKRFVKLLNADPPMRVVEAYKKAYEIKDSD